MPWENFALYSYPFTPTNNVPSTSVKTSQPLAVTVWLRRAASIDNTIERLEQINTNVLKAPIGSLKCTWLGSGQAGAPNRSTM